MVEGSRVRGREGRGGVRVGTYLLVGDEGAGQGHRGPEEDAAAEDDLPVEAVAQVTEDGGGDHEAADEHCEENDREEKASMTRLNTYLSTVCKISNST